MKLFLVVAIFEEMSKPVKLLICEDFIANSVTDDSDCCLEECNDKLERLGSKAVAAEAVAPPGTAVVVVEGSL